MQLQTEIIKFCRKIAGNKEEEQRRLDVQFRGQQANDLIREKLLENKPCMISRFGSNELDATICAWEKGQQRSGWRRVVRYVRGYGGQFWFDNSIRKRMSCCAGFFPTDNDHLIRFGELMLNDCRQLDVLGSSRPQEWRLRYLYPEAAVVDLIDLEPFRHKQPWTKALAGQRVLVVHPFVKSIRQQYAKRELLFEDPDVLPEFELLTIQSVQSSGRNQVPFSSWFEALDFMCQQISDVNFDIAVIGAGAYGMPLAAHVKRMGRKAVHLGGATQLWFGIMGERWNDGAYAYVENQHWCRPLEDERPPRADLIEQSCYW